MGVLYFAYGSNMSFAQMKYRCGSYIFVRRGYLKDYGFVYDGSSSSRNGAVANVVPYKGGIVWGGVFEIDELCEKLLDGYEGVSKGVYYKDNLRVYDDNGNWDLCLIYIGSGRRKVGKPSAGYKSIVVKGANDCKLPSNYISMYL